MPGAGVPRRVIGKKRQPQRNHRHGRLSMDNKGWNGDNCLLAGLNPGANGNRVGTNRQGEKNSEREQIVYS